MSAAVDVVGAARMIAEQVMRRTLSRYPLSIVAALLRCLPRARTCTRAIFATLGRSLRCAAARAADRQLLALQFDRNNAIRRLVRDSTAVARCPCLSLRARAAIVSCMIAFGGSRMHRHSIEPFKLKILNSAAMQFTHSQQTSRAQVDSESTRKLAVAPSFCPKRECPTRANSSEQPELL